MDDRDAEQSQFSERADGTPLDRADAGALRAVFQLTPTVLTITSLDDGRILDVNEAFVQASGYTREEVLGRPIGELNLWVDPAQRQQGLAILRTGRQIRGMEARFRMKSGGERVMILGAGVMTIDGRDCVVTALTDITGRTIAEEARRESERRFAQLFHANPLPMSIVSLRDGRHLDVNEAAVRHGGYSREEMLGRTKLELGFWVAPERREAMIEELRREGRVRDFEVEFRRRDGQVRQLLVNQEVITYSGEPAVLSVSLDITERKQAEGQAEARREETEALAEAAHLLARSLELTAVADEIVHRVRRLLRSKAALLTLLDVEGRTLTIESTSGAVGPLWTPGVTIPPGVGLAWRAIREGRVVTSEHILNDPAVRLTPEFQERVLAGGYRAVLAAPLVVNERVVGALSVGDDVGRVYADKEVRLVNAFAAHAAVAVANARLFHEVTTANRGKDEFLAMLGHELRNPLSTITSAAEVLDRVAPDSRSHHMARIIGRQARLLARLVDDLLDVARVTMGKLELDRRPVELQELAARCLDSLTEAGRTKAHTVALDGEPVFVEADAARLEQVVGNLIDNALKYTPKGGTVTVSTHREGGEAVLRVTDTGAGIRPEVLPRVFDLFTQEPRPLDRSPGGLGLGLALVRRLIELHDGSVSVTSPGPGQGSEFIVRLPALPVAPAHVHEPAETHRSLAVPRRRILIVEDNADARESLRHLLSLAGHEVFEAEDGVSALDKLAVYRPEIALIDIGLPLLDGYSVARLARQRDDMRDLCLVALTGYGQVDDQQRALEAGFNRHLTKPVNLAVLNDLLRREPRGAERR